MVKEVDAKFIMIWCVFWKDTKTQVKKSGGFLDKFSAERWIDENCERLVDENIEAQLLG